MNYSDEDLLKIYLRLQREKLCRKEINEGDTMKLFLCLKCQDIVRCFPEKRNCKCGESSGYYTDEIKAVFVGKYCVPLGIANSQFIKAIQMAEIENKHQKEPTTCKGVDFTSFVILDCATSISKLK